MVWRWIGKQTFLEIISKSKAMCDSLPWEGGGRGFCARLLQLLS
jgi:hypothetical protein